MENNNYDFFRAMMRADLKEKKNEKSLKNYAPINEESFNTNR